MKEQTKFFQISTKESKMKSLKALNESFKNEFSEFKVVCGGSNIDDGHSYEDYVIVHLNSKDLEQSFKDYFERVQKTLNTLFKKDIKLENTGNVTYKYKYIESEMNCKQFKTVITNENKKKYFHHEDVEVRFESNVNELCNVDIVVEYNHFKERTDLTCEKNKLNFEVIYKIIQNSFKEFNVGDFDYSKTLHNFYVGNKLTLEENFKYFDKVQEIVDTIFCDKIELKLTDKTKDYYEREMKQFEFSKNVVKDDKLTYIQGCKIEFLDNYINIYVWDSKKDIDFKS